jgi:hypothetical protein
MNAGLVLARLAERHDGLVFAEDAHAAGVSADELWRSTRRGELVRLHSGVAARLWGLTERFDDVIDITTTRRRRHGSTAWSPTRFRSFGPSTSATGTASG